MRTKFNIKINPKINPEEIKLNTNFRKGIKNLTIISEEKINELTNNLFIVSVTKRNIPVEIPLEEKKLALKNKFHDLISESFPEEKINKLFDTQIIDMNNFIVGYQMVHVFKRIISELNVTALIPMTQLCSFYRNNYDHLRAKDGIHFIIAEHFILRAKTWNYQENVNHVFTECFDFLKENSHLKGEYSKYLDCLKELSWIATQDYLLQSDDAFRIFCTQLDGINEIKEKNCFVALKTLPQ